MRREEDSFEGYRQQRLQELIAEELRSLLRDDARDPALQWVRIATLVLSPDYRHARVHFGVIAVASDRDARVRAERALARATPFLRARLAEAIDMKRTPDLRFVFDASFAEDPADRGSAAEHDGGRDA